jgi:hypothetical protein
MQVDPDDLDPEDPFELDDVNRPHLFAHSHYGQADLDDIYYGAMYYPAHEDEWADWFMVGQPPGEPPLVVPIGPARSGNPSKARPIGIYPASGEILSEYLRDTGQVQPSRRRR